MGLQRGGQTEHACKERLKEKDTMSCPIFHFSLVITFIINEMSNIQGSDVRQDTIGTLGCLCL